jgi:hypothetical protein
MAIVANYRAEVPKVYFFDFPTDEWDLLAGYVERW